MILVDLLENYIILKSRNREKYYDIKDNIDKYMPFIKDKLGYDLIIKENFIKLEKIPSIPQPFMGITEFEDKNEYIFFVILLMFLEDKNKEEQFILSNLTEYISLNYKQYIKNSEIIQWTDFKTRKSLVKVIKVALSMGIILKNDGDEDDFQKDEYSDVLYENTGISRYVVRNFKMEINDIEGYEDLLEKTDLYIDKSNIRKNSAYRKLILTPIVYNEGADDADYDYIKKFRESIYNSFEENLNWDLNIHKNGALVVLRNSSDVSDVFPHPNQKAESHATLFVNKQLNGMIKSNKFEISQNDTITISNEEFRNILIDIKNKDGHGFAKKFRDNSDNYFVQNVKEYMKDFSMIREEGKNIIIMPLVSKVIGEYPKDYIPQKGKDNGK